MLTSLRQLDEVLRGEATRSSSLRDGQVPFPVAGLSVLVVALGLVAGACVGSFALIRELAGDVYAGNGWVQMLASAVKLPLLFFLTLAVTLPSLYVFNALVGSRLTWLSVVRLMVAMLAVVMAVFASLGPIIVFFGLSTTSYPFMKLLNVAAAAVSGFLGLAFLLRTLDRLVTAQEAQAWEEHVREDEARRARDAAAAAAEGSPSIGEAAPAPAPHPISPERVNVVTDAGDSAGEGATSAEGWVEYLDPPTAGTVEASSKVEHYLASRSESAPRAGVGGRPGGPGGRGALDRHHPRTARRARRVFQIWIIVFALVGAQMSWVLRPFIGDPTLPTTFLRERGQSNFYIDVLYAIGEVMGINAAVEALGDARVRQQPVGPVAPTYDQSRGQMGGGVRQAEVIRTPESEEVPTQGRGTIQRALPENGESVEVPLPGDDGSGDR